MSDVEIHPYAPDDGDDVLAGLDILNRVAALDSPWERPTLPTAHAAMLRFGWDGEPQTPYLMSVAGEPVAQGSLSAPRRDNLHLAHLGLAVLPEQRRRGYGSLLWQHLVQESQALGRTSVLVDGWESTAVTGFADAHGLERRAQEIERRQYLDDVEPGAVERMFATAQEAAGDYELVRVVGRTPDDLLAGVVELSAAINDAPTDDLEVEDDVMSEERHRAYEESVAAQGCRMYRLIARHRETGELGGHTVVAVEQERPSVGEQHDTAVARAHRGHRLGLLLKAGMLRWLAEVEPQLETVDTWNAESNSFMISVNETLGYRVMGRALVFQRSI